MKILITGGTGKLATVLAKALAGLGHNIIINYRSDKKTALALAKQIKAQTIKADVTKVSDVKKMFNKIGKIDVLINCVGDFIYKPLNKTLEQEFAKCVENNLFSAWYCIKKVLPQMRKQRFGRIINFGSAGCSQITARPFTAPYYIAKTGLLMLTRSLAREEINNGITVNMISPGVLPHGVRPPGAPIIGYAAIANAVLFLLDEVANQITGANLDVSSGWRPE